MKRSRADLFEYLGAPLNNIQWSWGAVREPGGELFLVVWQDESMRKDGRNYSLVLNRTFWGNTTESHGLNERRDHLERVRQGAKTYLVMARAEKERSPGSPRRIIDINSDELFVAGEWHEDEQGNVWLERTARVSVEQVRSRVDIKGADSDE